MGRAGAGERCALNLAGVELADVARGDWLVATAAQHPTECIDVRLKVLAGEAGPLEHWTPLHVHIGAADVPARLALRRGESIAAGASALAQLRLARPVHAAHGDRLIVRDQSATRTIGGGAVVNPFASQLRRSERDGVLAALDGNDVVAAAEQLLKECPDGLRIDWLARVYNLPPAAIEAHLPAYARVMRAGTSRALSDRRAEQLRQSIVERIGRWRIDIESETDALRQARLGPVLRAA